MCGMCDDHDLLRAAASFNADDGPLGLSLRNLVAGNSGCGGTVSSGAAARRILVVPGVLEPISQMAVFAPIRQAAASAGKVNRMPAQSERHQAAPPSTIWSDATVPAESHT